MATPNRRRDDARSSGIYDLPIDGDGDGGDGDGHTNVGHGARWQALLELLDELGAGDVKHSGATLREHLVGTAEILARWGLPGHVVRAGLFHSVYGTEIFTRATTSLDARPRVRAAIGEGAERLAFLFGTVQRATVLRAACAPAPRTARDRDGRPVPLSRADVSALLHLLWANELEQRGRVRLTPRVRDRERRALDATRKWLVRSARAELDAGLSLDLGVEHHSRRAERRREGHGGARAEGGELRPRLARLLALESTASFLRDGWAERCHVSRGPVERLSGLCDYDFDALSSMKATYRRAFFVRDGVVHTENLERGCERAAYEAGATIYFHGIETPDVRAWVHDLDSELGLVRGLTRVSAFASKTGRGLPAHYDLNDNFVCQARGKKRWRLAPNTHVRFPLYGYTIGKPITPAHHAEAPGGLPRAMPEDERRIELDPGTVMFVPRGVWHATETTEDASVHFNIQCGMPTFRDLIDFTLSRTPLSCASELRAPALGLFDEDGALTSDGVQAIATKLERVLGSLRTQNLRAFVDEFHRYTTVRRTRLFEYPY